MEFIEVPLNLFDNVDLSMISEIVISFNQTDAGAIMINNIFLK